MRRDDDASMSMIIFLAIMFAAFSVLFYYKDQAMFQSCRDSGRSVERCEELLK